MTKVCLVCDARFKMPGTPDDKYESHGLCGRERCQTIFDAWCDTPQKKGKKLKDFIREFEEAPTWPVIFISHPTLPS